MLVGAEAATGKAKGAGMKASAPGEAQHQMTYF